MLWYPLDDVGIDGKLRRQRADARKLLAVGDRARDDQGAKTVAHLLIDRPRIAVVQSDQAVSLLLPVQQGDQYSAEKQHRATAKTNKGIVFLLA